MGRLRSLESNLRLGTSILMIVVSSGLIGCACAESRYGVRIVVAKDFRGTVRLIFDRSGTSPNWDGNTLVFKVPQSGKLIINHANPFLEWVDDFSVVREDGTPVDMAYRMNAPPDGDVLWRVAGGNPDGTEYWAVIGTKQEETAAANRLQMQISDELKELRSLDKREL